MKIVCGLLRDEFSFKYISINHNKLSDFYKSQWQTRDEASLLYLFYRLVIALTFLISLIVDISTGPTSGNKWMIYLTHWGYLICSLQSFLSFSIVAYVYAKTRTNSGSSVKPELNPKLCAAYWVLFTISVDVAVSITCIYWTAVYDSNKDTLGVIGIFVHVMNSVIMLTDLFVVAHPMRLLHCYWPLMFAVLYAVFNVAYYLLGGTDIHGFPYIYSIMDWRKPWQSTLITFLAMIFLIFLHVIVYSLFLLRRSLHRKYGNRHAELPITMEPVKNDVNMHI